METAELTMKRIGTKTSEEPIKWSAKMLESFAQAERGEIHKIDINNFWDV